MMYLIFLFVDIHILRIASYVYVYSYIYRFVYHILLLLLSVEKLDFYGLS